MCIIAEGGEDPLVTTNTVVTHTGYSDNNNNPRRSYDSARKCFREFPDALGGRGIDGVMLVGCLNEYEVCIDKHQRQHSTMHAEHVMGSNS